MNNKKSKRNEETYKDADGHIFNPDPMREIPIAAQLIVGFAEKGISGNGLTTDDLKLIRKSAVRIIAEMQILEKE